MNKDFRVSITFPGHPKAVKLNRRLGGEGILALLQLWAYTATDRPNGVLSGMDEEDIEIASKWTGEAGIFFKTISDLRFIEHKKNEWVIKDWKEHNPWAVNAKARSAKATKAAQARWKKNYEDMQEDDSSNAPSITSSNANKKDKQCGNDDLADAPILPLPSHSSPEVSESSSNSLSFEHFWKEYPKKKGKDQAEKAWKNKKFKQDDIKIILESLKAQKMSPDWLKENGQFIPYPSKWINEGRWKDEVTTQTQSITFKGVSQR